MKKNILLTLYSFVIPFSLISQVFDFEGNKYDTVQIGSQVWLKQNTKSKRYWDGNEVSPNNYKCPNGDCSKVDSFGLLYNYKGISKDETGNIIEGICPKGYAIPTPQQWHELMLYLNADTTWLWKGAYNNIAQKLMDSTYGGSMYGGTATNESGLTFLPAGINLNNVFYNFGQSTDIRLVQSNQIKDIFLSFNRGSANTVNIFDFNSQDQKNEFLSCRCIKGETITANNNLTKLDNWEVYPNPCKDGFYISSKEGLNINAVDLISINGQKLKLTPNLNGKYLIVDKPTGIYFIRISDQLFTRFVKLIIL